MMPTRPLDRREGFRSMEALRGNFGEHHVLCLYDCLGRSCLKGWVLPPDCLFVSRFLENRAPPQASNGLRAQRLCDQGAVTLLRLKTNQKDQRKLRRPILPTSDSSLCTPVSVYAQIRRRRGGKPRPIPRARTLNPGRRAKQQRSCVVRLGRPRPSAWSDASPEQDPTLEIKSYTPQYPNATLSTRPTRHPHACRKGRNRIAWMIRLS
jgi:hypothetical protein